ncbi:hypothetical protein EDD16DRAFT_1551030 [Pisolithus croceorrhizus]|nr:hypothetical protein EV401DRAFT_109347 [Pisolithus croceorrhizus]KAI6127927.1 hypothetical protein EDD16DRAFT_1551030 [Pisolithus croceorrhizus]KAI6158535.1 hypothetical protein EDD17DRAFT_1621913 [Pisolithus thermaeus]
MMRFTKLKEPYRLRGTECHRVIKGSLSGSILPHMRVKHSSLFSSFILTTLVPPEQTTDPLTVQVCQRLQVILSSTTPLTLLTPTRTIGNLRISFVLRLYHSLDTQIISLEELNWSADVGEANLVVIGCAREPLVQAWLERTRRVWSSRDGTWCISERREFNVPSSAMPLR